MSQETTVLTPQNWADVLWAATRITMVVSHEPSAISLKQNVTPCVVWGESRDFIAMLDYVDNLITLHISEELPEAIGIALVGICALREIKWEFVEEPNSELESQIPLITSFMLRH